MKRSKNALIYKFGTPQGKDCAPFRYSDVFEFQSTSGLPRVCIGAAAEHLQLLSTLAAALTEPLAVLYVLHTSRCDNALSRYQSPPLDWKEIRRFFATFEGFLQCDARHDLWLHSKSDDTTVVYERHNLIYAYGPIDHYVHRLTQRGFQQRRFRIPVPHIHHYHPTYDEDERRIVNYFPWRHSPLRTTDVQRASGEFRTVFRRDT